MQSATWGIMFGGCMANVMCFTMFWGDAMFWGDTNNALLYNYVFRQFTG
jgi:hypothetical protein